MGRFLIFAGLVLLLLGIMMECTSFNLNWFGKLPGDIRINRPGFSLYIPIVSMFVVSVIVSVLLWLYRKFVA